MTTLTIAIGAMIVAAALAFVIDPLVGGPADAKRRLVVRPPSDDAEDPVAALRAVEFDYRTGKLSDADHDMLRARYPARAASRTSPADAGSLTAQTPVTDA